MTIRTGSCLCGAMGYEVEGEMDGPWVCHCSLCRKASGANGLAIITLADKAQLRWLRGEQEGVRFVLRPTWQIIRCRACGTPVPGVLGDGTAYVTAGTLDTPLGQGVRIRQFCASRADWDRDAPDMQRYDQAPDEDH